MNNNPHFKIVSSWQAAENCLNFQPREPQYTAGYHLQSIQIHIRDHKLRELDLADRTLEGHYGSFVVSQARKGLVEAKRLALSTSYGNSGKETIIANHAARVYELGPETSATDIDGRSPAVVTWHDGEMFYLIASIELASVELMKVAKSLYPA